VAENGFPAAAREMAMCSPLTKLRGFCDAAYAAVMGQTDPQSSQLPPPRACVGHARTGLIRHRHLHVAFCVQQPRRYAPPTADRDQTTRPTRPPVQYASTRPHAHVSSERSDYRGLDRGHRRLLVQRACSGLLAPLVAHQHLVQLARTGGPRRYGDPWTIHAARWTL